MAADTARQIEPCLLQVMQPKYYLYATFGAVPSRSVIPALVIWRLGALAVHTRLGLPFVSSVSSVSRLFLASPSTSPLVLSAAPFARSLRLAQAERDCSRSIRTGPSTVLRTGLAVKLYSPVTRHSSLITDLQAPSAPPAPRSSPSACWYCRT